jgi:hypothetical protein
LNTSPVLLTGELSNFMKNREEMGTYQSPTNAAEKEIWGRMSLVVYAASRVDKRCKKETLR